METDRGEIEDAHDLLSDICKDPASIGPIIPLNMVRTIEATGEALCWALGHENGEQFGEFLKLIRERIAARGGDILARAEREQHGTEKAS